MQASSENSPRQSPKKPVNTPQATGRTTPRNSQGNRPRMSPGCSQQSPRILKDSAETFPGQWPKNTWDLEYQKHFARLAQDSPRQSHKHSPRAWPMFPKHCERLPQGLPEELTKIPQAPCKISHGVPNIIVKYCPSHLGMKIHFERLPKECPKDSRELFGELPG